VVDVPAIAAARLARGETAIDHAVEERPHDLAVSHPGKRGVLPPEAVAAVERNRHEKLRLPRREPERLQGTDPVVKRDHRRSK
jgi:hypothetical protein